MAESEIKVNSANVTYTSECIESRYAYQNTEVTCSESGGLVCTPTETTYTFRTQRNVPKVGVMMVGWGGNNGSTVTGAVLANKLGLSWETKEGVRKADYFGSITQASTVLLGSGPAGDVYVPFKNVLPMLSPNDIIFDGWDINSMNIADAMGRAQVFDIGLQKQLRPHMANLKPRPSIYYPDFIAANQSDRADNLIEGGTKEDHVQKIRDDIRQFKNEHQLDKVIVLWTANTERYADIRDGLNDTADNLLKSIHNNHSEVSASTVFAVASILEGCTYINGAPQNTFVPGCIELAQRHKVFIGGDDFKSGQTKVKSVLADFLVSAGIKPTSIVSYNHLGNNDGKNLSSERQFRSKELSKRNVVDDMVESNRILYKPDEHPDHCIVIKYVPYVGDSKRAMDEYTSEIMMGGKNTLVLHNTCEDSLLASPLILDLIILAEMCQRITFKVEGDEEFQSFHSILTILSYLLKAPLVPQGTPLVNALFRQKACIENIFRACIGLSPLNHMMLEHKHQNLVSQPVKSGAGFGTVVKNGAALHCAAELNGSSALNGAARNGVKIGAAGDSDEGEK